MTKTPCNIHSSTHHNHGGLETASVCRRTAFTLIELMVVIGIVLLIAVMTASAINLTISGDKVRAGARQVQSYLAGARDRAIYSKAPRGVRFLLDPTNNRTVSSMVYIAPTESWSQGAIEIDWYGSQVIAIKAFDNQSNCVSPTGWLNLYNQGLLRDGARIRIPNTSVGVWYTIKTDLLANASPDYSDGPNNPVLLLTTPYSVPPTKPDNGNFSAAFTAAESQPTYLLELPPSVLPNQEPVQMPKGAVIHLDRSSTNPEPANASGRGDKLPDSWKRPTSTGDASGFDYTSQLDVMFTPRGIVIGPAAQRGVIHFYIADQKDADRDRIDWSSGGVSAPENNPRASDNYQRGDKVVLSLFTHTGAVSTHPVFSDTDRFKFAETGEVAGK